MIKNLPKSKFLFPSSELHLIPIFNYSSKPIFKPQYHKKQYNSYNPYTNTSIKP